MCWKQCQCSTYAEIKSICRLVFSRLHFSLVWTPRETIWREISLHFFILTITQTPSELFSKNGGEKNEGKTDFRKQPQRVFVGTALGSTPMLCDEKSTMQTHHDSERKKESKSNGRMHCYSAKHNNNSIEMSRSENPHKNEVKLKVQ